MPGRHSPLTCQHSIERLLDLSFASQGFSWFPVSFRPLAEQGRNWRALYWRR